MEIFALSPDYGAGIARRRIRLTGRPGQVFVELEDHVHAMRCLISHDGERVTAVAPEFIRVPMSSCLGAGEPLAGIVGTPVGCDFASFFSGGRAKGNCTHMFDMAWLGIAHAARGETVRDYNAVIPDAVDDHCEATLFRDGEQVLRWELQGSVIQSPAAMAGVNLFRDYYGWARANYTGDDLESLAVLQKACFVAASRRWLMPQGPVTQVQQQTFGGNCHGYDPERVRGAHRFGNNLRDFTNRPDDLLKFL